MLSLLKNKTTLGIIVVLICGGALYYYYSGSGETALLTVPTDSSPLSQDLLISLGALHTIKLDPAIFSDTTFNSLSDFGVTIPPQTPGRRNPFAPPGN